MNLEAALAERVGPLAGQAPHRPLAQRPGRDRPAALDAPGDRRARRRAASTSSGRSSGWPSARATAVLPGTTHIQPAQPVLFAHHLLAYVEMAERDRGRLADARARVNVSPLGSGALAGAGYPLDREATAAELGFDGVTRELARRGLGPRLRGRDAGGGRARDGPPQPARRGDHLVVEPAVRVRPRRRRVLDRQLDDAEQEEPGPGRAGPWPRCPRHRGADRRADAAQGPPAGVPARPPGGRRAAVRRGRGLRGVARRHGRAGRHADGRRRPDGRGRGRGLHDRDGRRRRARPARRPVPGRPPHRRLARRPGGGRGHRRSTRSATR